MYSIDTSNASSAPRQPGGPALGTIKRSLAQDPAVLFGKVGRPGLGLLRLPGISAKARARVEELLEVREMWWPLHRYGKRASARGAMSSRVQGGLGWLLTSCCAFPCSLYRRRTTTSEWARVTLAQERAHVTFNTSPHESSKRAKPAQNIRLTATLPCCSFHALDNKTIQHRARPPPSGACPSLPALMFRLAALSQFSRPTHSARGPPSFHPSTRFTPPLSPQFLLPNPSRP